MPSQAPQSTSAVPAKLYGLDHLRALAILLVFLFHYQIPIFGHPVWLPDYAKFGWTGVDLFFVLSGFLIASQLFAQIKAGGPVSLKEFFIKRFFRILPAYWVVVAIYFCFPFFHEREQLAPLWKYLSFTQNLGLDIRTTGTFSHAWSLCVEEHFYITLPFILLLLSPFNYFKRGYLLVIVLFVGGVVIRNYNWTHIYLPAIDTEDSGVLWYQYIYYPTYTRLDGLLTGVSVAALYNFLPRTWHKISQYGNRLTVLGLLVLTGAYFVCYDQHSYMASVFGFPLVAIGYGLLVAGAVSPSCFLYKWRSRVTGFIAALSYALYLTHKGIIHITQALLTNLHIDTDSNLTLLLCIICCILAAWILNLAIEKPFMRWRNRIVKSPAN